MIISVNEDIADRLEEVVRLLAEQGATRFRVRAYQRAARTLRGLPRSVAEILKADGIAGLENLPGVGDHIARAIRDMLGQGRWPMLNRLRGEHDPRALLGSVPGIGESTARKLYEDLGIQTLEELEAAAYDGRLEDKIHFRGKRLTGVRDSLAHRLGRIRGQSNEPPSRPPPIAELLDVDAEYRAGVAAGTLKRIAPRRFNPGHETWLPVLHTRRAGHDYTALFSNTPRAHNLGRDHDWVILYRDGKGGDYQCTAITSEFGPLKSRRIVRGREAECADYYGVQLPTAAA